MKPRLPGPHARPRESIAAAHDQEAALKGAVVAGKRVAQAAGGGKTGRRRRNALRASQVEDKAAGGADHAGGDRKDLGRVGEGAGEGEIISGEIVSDPAVDLVADLSAELAADFGQVVECAGDADVGELHGGGGDPEEAHAFAAALE